MNSPVPSPSSGPTLPTPRDDLCLDFANTRYWRGSDPATETLHDPVGLLAWVRSSGSVDPALLARLEAAWRDWPDTAGPAFGQAIVLREALYAVFATLTAGAEPSVADLDTVNAALRRTPARTTLDRRDGRFVWRLGPADAVDGLLAPVLWSAGDLLSGTRLGRVRRCANDRCGWLFLDDSKSANRRWCSMSQCGNRAKAHRHYAKRRQAEG